MPLSEAIELALEGGVRAVQLREKDLSLRELLALAEKLRHLTREFGAKLFINDRVDIAIDVEADGIHLGGQSMPTPAVRSLVGGKMLIGVSTHGIDQAAQAAAEGADFITVGPIYHTPSKAKYGEPLGLEPLRRIKKAIDIPIFALGGIRGRNIGHVLWAGAYGISMISTILGSDDIRKAAQNVTNMITIVDRAICVECGRR